MAAKQRRISFEGWVSIIFGLVVAVVGAGSAPWWWAYLFPKDTAVSDVVGMAGGCEPFRVYAQNRWDPVGTAVRVQPNVESRQVEGVAPNKVIMVDGWVHSRPAYPTNTAPWNNDIWYHLADDSGWVSFAGVRYEPTSYDATGLSENGGTPALLATECEGAMN